MLFSKCLLFPNILFTHHCKAILLFQINDTVILMLFQIICIFLLNKINEKCGIMNSISLQTCVYISTPQSELTRVLVYGCRTST